MDVPELGGLKVYHVAINAEVETPLRLPESQPGMALRGALFNAMWSRFCTNKAAPTCAECPLNRGCPVSALVAPLREESVRGRDVPRPFSIRPPLLSSEFQPGDNLSFGLTLFGRVLPLLPYVVMSARAMGEGGVGAPGGLQNKRGRFRVHDIQALNLITGAQESLLDSKRQVRFPDLAVDAAVVDARTAALPSDTVEIEFLTPLRLVDRGELVKRPLLRPLLQRLVERLTALEQEYGAADTRTRYDFASLFRQAEQVRLVEDRTTWRDVTSYSARQGRGTPIGGLVGKARFSGPLHNLLGWLAWGEATQVGKDVVKGNGWYRLS